MGRGWFGVVKFRIAKFIQPEKNCGDRAVLVAISIPIFTSQLEKSRDAVTVSNIRAAYAQASAAYLSGVDSNDTTVVKGTADNSIVVKGVVAKGTADGFAGDINSELPVKNPAGVADMGNSKKGTDGKFDVTFTWTANSDAAPTVSVAPAEK